MVVVCGGLWWQAAMVCGGSKPFLLCSRQQPREKRAESASSLALCCWCGVCWSAQRWRSTRRWRRLRAEERLKMQRKASEVVLLWY
jgi:hypothetical protein